MASTSPTRIDDDLYATAKAVGEVMSRSASQQIAHWARIGRELEAAESVSHRDIARVLSGAHDYDALPAEEQAVVRAEWAEQVTARRTALDLSKTLAGRGFSELDADGAVVVRPPKRARTA